MESLKPLPLFALIFLCLTYVSHRDFHLFMASSLGTPNVSPISLHFASLYLLSLYLEFCLSHKAGYWCTRSIKDSPILVVSNSNVQCKVKTVSLILHFCYLLSFTWVRVGFVLVPDISLWLGYCFDISLLSLFICCWFWLQYTWFGYQLIVSVYLLLILAWIHLILISAYCLCLSVADFGLNTLDFDISLLYLVSNAETDDYELVLCSCTVTTSLLLHRIFPEFRCENVLCVAGCCRHDIAANLQHQNRGKFALCVSRH